MAERPSFLNQTSYATFRPDSLDTAAWSMSTPVLWEKSYLCPCRNKATRQPNPSCPRCHGRGIGFLPPTSIDMLIQSEEKGVFNGDIGIVDSGTAIGTPADRETRLAFRDRITLPNVQVTQHFIFDVTERRVNKGFYLVYDVKDIQYALIMDRELSEGEDYRFDRGKNMFYPDESLIGENVSLNISTTLRYLVSDLLKEHRYGRDQSGKLIKTQQKLLLKREDYFIDKEAFSLGVDEDTGQMIDTKRPGAVDGLNGFFRHTGGES